MKKRSGYWSNYHRSQINNPLVVYTTILLLVARLPEPWQRKSHRGRPNKFQAREHAALVIYCIYANHTLRYMEGEAPLLVGKTIDHSTIGKSMKRLSEEYIKLVIKFIEKKISPKEEPYLIADSTGISTDYKNGKERREPLKLSVLVKYYPRHGLCTIINTHVEGMRIDFHTLKHLLVPGKGEILIADRGFDSEENFKLCFKNNYVPIIKQRNTSYHGWGRRKARRLFKEYIYRKRGVAEGVFSETEKTHTNRTRCRLNHTQRVWITGMCLAKNLKVFLRWNTTNGIMLIVIYSTNPP